MPTVIEECSVEIERQQTYRHKDRQSSIRGYTDQTACDMIRAPLRQLNFLEEKGMRRLLVSIAVVALVSTSVVLAQGGFKRISEFLTSYEEVPSVSSTGNGEFNAQISKDGSRIEWELSYEDLEGAVQQAHIHIGNVGVNGGISVFLCTNLGNGPAGTQPCPAPPAKISGTIFAADVSPNIPATAAAR